MKNTINRNRPLYRTCLLPILLLIGHIAPAQQLNTSSFYELYSVLHNPATAGSKQKAIVGSSFKTQWSSMPGSPRTALAYGQTYLPKPRLGLGGYLYHDQTGPTSRTGLQMAYAYHIPLQENRFLSFGFEARLQQLSFDREKLQQELGTVDPALTGSTTRMKADAGFGMAYTTSHLQLGISVSQLVQSNYKLYELAGTLSEQSKLYRHYYLHGSYTFVPDDFTKMTPSLLLIYLPNAPLEMQTGIRLLHNDLIWYGLSWRARQGWMISAGVTVKEKFSIGYSFDIYNAPLSIYQKGSSGHELLLQYNIN